MQAADTAGTQGISRRVRSLAASLLELAHTRAQLFGTEVELQAEQLRKVALLGLGALVLLSFALVFGSAFVVAIFWDTHRLAALAVVTLVHLAGALACLFAMRALLRGAPRPFAATIEELRRDLSHLRR